MSKKKTPVAKVLTAPIRISQDTLTVSFPKNLADHLGLTGKEVFYTVVNGVVQISGTQPKMVIPMFTDDDTFEPQPKEKPARRQVAAVEPE